MSLPVKAALGCGGLASASLAGCYFGGVFSDTPGLFLKEETGKSYSGKIGESYSVYLLAVRGTKGDNQDFNKPKWEELHRQYLLDSENSEIQMSAQFASKKVTSAYDSSTTAGSDSSTALNKVCEFVYEKSEGTSDDTGVDFSNPSGSNNRDRLAKDLLKYCSPIGKKPTTIGENEGYPNNSLGVTKKDILVSVGDPENYYFGQAQERWFANETAPKSDLFFKKFFDVNTNALNTSMWKICHEAYGLTGEDSTSKKENPKKEDVEKYCSFRKITS